MPPLAEIIPPGKLRLNFHVGQRRAWDSTARFVCVIAGTQSGKTSFGPHWLRREIQRRGPGDYLVVAPTYPLLSLKTLPEFLNLFRRTLRLGDYVGSPTRCFTLSPRGEQQTFGGRQDVATHVYFGHASDPDSLESATAKAAWLDEAGQNKFRLGSWEAIQRRLSIAEGRVLITTTPYNLGWLKQKLHDPWKRGDTSIEVIRFDSTTNPVFPVAEFARARATLPAWKFNLYYRGIFTRPAGLIYDSFDPDRHTCPRFTVDPRWARYLGLDFGGQNTAGVFFAEDPGNGKLYAYREYGPTGGATAAQHVAALTRGEPYMPVVAGGAKSEQQWRDEFAAGGMPVHEPDVSEVEIGINRVYGAFATGRIIVFNDLDGLLDELGSYSRVVDDAGEITEEIQDKNEYHLLDAVRYIVPSCIVERTDGDDAPTVLRT